MKTKENNAYTIISYYLLWYLFQFFKIEEKAVSWVHATVNGDSKYHIFWVHATVNSDSKYHVFWVHATVNGDSKYHVFWVHATVNGDTK